MPNQDLYTLQCESQPKLDLEMQQIKDDNIELNHLGIAIRNEVAKTEISEKSSIDEGYFYFSDRLQRTGRISIFLFVIAFLMIGRFSVPNIEVPCIQDKVLNVLQFANDFVNASGNEIFRNFFQLFCSLLVDTVFLITFGYWVLHGKSARLPVALAVFYVTRALIQKIWFSPFPQGFYWESPGIPSLVVPYGRGSDFFFSGHSGFLVICASEWHKLKMPKVRNFVMGVGIYTILILLIYRIHYSIDIFTGVIFAEWCFSKVDSYKGTIDNYWVYCMAKVRKLITKKQSKRTPIKYEAPSLAPQDQEVDTGKKEVHQEPDEKL